METATLHFATTACGSPYLATLVNLRSHERDRAHLHRHADFYELFYVCAGKGRHWNGEQAVPLQAGDLVLARPRDSHAFAGMAPAGLRFINVAFPAAAWRAFLALAEPPACAGWDMAPEPPMAHLSGGAVPSVEAAFLDVLAAYHRRPAMLELIGLWSVAVRALLGAATPADHGVRTAHPMDNAGHAAPEWLASACLAMREPANLHAGLKRLQELAAVSEGHLRRSMRRYYGTTPVRFVADLRVEHAATLLVTSAASVTQVALRCGFSSPSYFSKEFTRAHGIAPRELRRRASRIVVP